MGYKNQKVFTKSFLFLQQTERFHRLGELGSDSDTWMGRMRASPWAASSYVDDCVRFSGHYQAMASWTKNSCFGSRRVLQAGRSGKAEFEFNSDCKPRFIWFYFNWSENIKFWIKCSSFHNQKLSNHCHDICNLFYLTWTKRKKSQFIGIG